MISKVFRQKARKTNLVCFKPFSMAFWLSVALLAFVCAAPLWSMFGASTVTLVPIVEGEAVAAP